MATDLKNPRVVCYVPLADICSPSKREHNSRSADPLFLMAPLLHFDLTRPFRCKARAYQSQFVTLTVPASSLQ